MKRLHALGIAFFLLATSAHAQQGVAGTYSGYATGHLLTGKSEVQMGVRIDISAVDGKILAGRMQQAVLWRCRGEAPAEGIVSNNKIIFWSVEEVGHKGCGRARFVGTVDGDGFVGKWGGAESKLARSAKPVAPQVEDVGVTGNQQGGNAVYGEPPGDAPKELSADVIDAVPAIKKSGREGFQKFLASQRRPKVFVINDRGNWAWKVGPGAIQQALQLCESFAPAKCDLFAVDDEVVWTAPAKKTL